MLPHAYIVSLNDRARRKFFSKKFHQQRLDRFRSLRERLQHQYVVVPINNYGGKKIALRIDQSVRICFRSEGPARGSLTNPCAPPFAVDRLAILCQKATRDLRTVAVKSLANKITVFILDAG